MNRLILQFGILTLLVVAWSSPQYTNAQGPLTFSEHIAPIIYQNCSRCHRPGEIAPFSLTTYVEVASMAPSVKQSVLSGTMPPWHPDPGYSSFLDERIMSQDDKQKLIDWIDNGMAEGNPALLPPLPTYPTGSQIGTPDLVLRPDSSFLITRNRDEYICYAWRLDRFLQGDTFAVAIEPRAGNTGVVHHMTVYMDTSGYGLASAGGADYARYNCEEDPAGKGAFMVAGWAPGNIPRTLPPGFGFKLHKDGYLILQCHYAPDNVGQRDSSVVNIFFARQPTDREVYMRYMINLALYLPPNQITTFFAQNTLDTTISIIGVYPHMHLLGKSQRVYAVTPELDTIPLCYIPRWDFHWQGFYTFPKPIKVPKGSRLRAVATYDNTIDNPNNPNNPPIAVTWGEGTKDEMLACAFQEVIYRPGDEDIRLDTDPLSTHTALAIPTRFFSAWPNPLGQHLRLDYQVEPNVFDLQLELITPLGHVVYRQPLVGWVGTAELTLPPLSAGIYLMQVRRSQGPALHQQKLLIQH
jgi:hypothetical protein